MIKYVLYLLFALTTYSSASISATTRSSEEILQSSLPNSCNFSGTFTQEKQLQGLPKPLQSSGDFFFSCDYGLVWQTARPIKEIRIYTTENIHFSIAENQEPQTLSGIANFYLAKLLLDIMSGNTKQLYTDYNVNINNAEKLDITLTPKNKYLKKGLKSIQFLKGLADKENTSIKVNITDANQQVTAMSITENTQYTDKKAIALCETIYGSNTCAILKDPSQYEQNESF